MIDRDTHDRVVRWIAATRFPFPGQQSWPADYVTITNETEQRRSVPTTVGPVFPDIVVVDGKERIREGGVVETEVREEMAATWAALSPAFDDDTKTGVRHFFVYVPRGTEQQALALLRLYDISF